MAETPLVIRDRAVALTDYLLAVRAQVERPVRTVSTADAFWQNGFPRHPELAVGPSSGSDAWLRVGLPVAEKPIVVPVQFRNLVLSGVTHDREPRLLPEVDSDVLAAFEAWRDREWRPWARRAAETEAVRSLHLRLFDLKYRLDMNAATEELVWGHGIGELRVDGARVSYPLFATPVAIEYDPDGPTVFVSPQGFTRLQTDPITGIDERRLRQLVEFCGAGGQVTTDLWDDVERRELFEGVLRRLGVDPVIREASSPAPTGQHIHDTGVLFARPRQRMLRRFLQKLRDRLLAGDLDSIGSLAAILAHEPSALRMPGDRPDTWAPVGERLLMPLSTNEAQESIAYRLAGSRTVAVQGPPGTGKTHTIRNLICHLMAHGKRVLVLAQKNDPLTVLRDGLPADIQPLCIAVLGRSTDQLIQLQLAARELSDRAATMDHRAGQAEVDRLSQGLQDAERDLARALNNLRNIAEKESACYDIDGATLSISEVGTWLRERQGDLAEIPDAINRSAPLSVAEFTVLLKLANRVPAADRVQALHVLPTTDDLPSASELTSRRRRRHAATTEADRLSAAGVDLNKIRGLGQVALRALVGDLRDAQRVLGGREGGWTGRLGDLLADRHWQQLWDDHAAACDRAMQELAAVARALAGHDVRVSPELAAEQRRLSGMLTELRERFTAGKGVSKVFQSALARVAAGCLVDGEPLRSAADVDLILAFLRRYQLRQELGRRWAEWAPRVGLTLPEPLGEPELWAGRLFSDAATALDWDRRRWPALCQVLRPLGVPTPTPVSAANLGVVQDILTRADVVFELDALVDAEQQITDLLRSGQSGPDASPLWRVLDLSWQDADLPRWDALCAEATRLAALRADADTYRSLHGRLAAVAPGWAAEIDAGTARVLSGLGADCERRWEWRRAQTWFDQTIAGADPAELGRALLRAGLDPFEGLGRDLRRGRQDVPGAAHADQHDGDRVGDDVVEFAGDGRAFPLCRDLVELLAFAFQRGRAILQRPGVAPPGLQVRAEGPRADRDGQRGDARRQQEQRRRDEHDPGDPALPQVGERGERDHDGRPARRVAQRHEHRGARTGRDEDRQRCAASEKQDGADEHGHHDRERGDRGAVVEEQPDLHPGRDHRQPDVEQRRAAHDQLVVRRPGPAGEPGHARSRRRSTTTATGMTATVQAGRTHPAVVTDRVVWCVIRVRIPAAPNGVRLTPDSQTSDSSGTAAKFTISRTTTPRTGLRIRAPRAAPMIADRTNATRLPATTAVTSPEVRSGPGWSLSSGNASPTDTAVVRMPSRSPVRA
ncbi:hypothetical protein GCM10009558_011970 [Virgisporangium aurantiacum]